MRLLKAVCTALALAAMLWALQTRHGIIPPLGKLLNPFIGFWRNNAGADSLPNKLNLPCLKSRTTVVWDDRHVPHIFAADELDLFRAQGFFTARDRLWQMEFISRFAGGRLAEIIGPQAVEMDLLQRRLGMTWGAENFIRGLDGNTAMLAVIDAYCEGVNAFVGSLGYADYPLEYKILDCHPKNWTIFDIALLMKYMAWDLTGGGSDYELTRTRSALGEAETDKLFPLRAPFQDPVIPAGTEWKFTLPAGAPVARGRSGDAGVTRKRKRNVVLDPFAELVGSNNWAVSGRKTKSGFPILCNDPHLQLTLPSIWYEIQLSAPGLNVRGVSLPGAPGVIIGFTENIAWGVTNAGSDVLDFFKISFRNQKHEEYTSNGKWVKTSPRREEIKVRGGKSIITDVLYTHLGPVPFPEQRNDIPDWIPVAAAMRWTGHDASGIMEAIYTLNHARNYWEFKKAIVKFDCPAQNIIYAGNDGRIAIWHNGKFPLRAKGQGRYLLDGSKLADEWTGWVRMENVPHSEDPTRGFVSSANQCPTDDAYPYYLGWDYATFERGARINEILSVAPPVTPEAMIIMQGDALSLRARSILPSLLELMPKTGLTAEEQARVRELERWDFVYRAESIEPTVFNRFWIELYTAIWSDDLDKSEKLFLAPAADMTMKLILHEPDSPYFDDLATPVHESLRDIVRLAFSRALDWLQELHGACGPSWRWGQANPVTIGHLGRIPGLGALPLTVSGNRGVINAACGSHGPSWRMVVEMGQSIRAWGILPGGASGNPGSRFYDNGIRDWVEGKTYELLFLKSSTEAHARIVGRTEIGGSR